MSYKSIIIPKTANIAVSHQTNLGVDNYDLDELYSPDTDQWRQKVLDLGPSKSVPNKSYWFDRSRYRNNGTINGAVWKQQPSGIWAMSFDGTDDYIDAGSAANLRVTRGSILVWIKPATVAAGTGFIAGLPYDDGATWDSPYTGFQIARADKTLLWYGTVQGTYIIYQSAAVFAVDTWYHAVITWDGTTAKGYVNASEVISQVPATGGDITYGSPNPSYVIGQRSKNAAGEYFNGLIPVVRTYNRCLTATEIQRHYLATKWEYQ